MIILYIIISIFTYFLLMWGFRIVFTLLLLKSIVKAKEKRQQIINKNKEEKEKMKNAKM
jgi:predicted membrane protein